MLRVMATAVTVLAVGSTARQPLSIRVLISKAAMRWSWILLVVLLPSCGNQRGLHDSHEPRAEVDLFLMSYNIMWEENGVRAGHTELPVWQDRRALVREVIQTARPDIIGLQEASLEQQVGLSADNPEYGILYDQELNNTNPIMYRATRFVVEDSGAFVMNDVPEEHGTNIGLRKASFARFVEIQSGRRFAVYNVHLDHRGSGSTRQLCAVRLIERIAAETVPVFLTGDFNCSETSPAMRFFYGEQSLINDQREPYENPQPLRDALEIIDPSLVDHVLVGRNVKVLSASYLDTVNPQASDHFPVMAEVVF